MITVWCVLTLPHLVSNLFTSSPPPPILPFFVSHLFLPSCHDICDGLPTPLPLSPNILTASSSSIPHDMGRGGGGQLEKETPKCADSSVRPPRCLCMPHCCNPPPPSTPAPNLSQSLMSKYCEILNSWQTPATFDVFQCPYNPPLVTALPESFQ